MENEIIKIKGENNYKNMNIKKMKKLALITFIIAVIGIFLGIFIGNIADDYSRKAKDILSNSSFKLNYEEYLSSSKFYYSIAGFIVRICVIDIFILLFLCMLILILLLLRQNELVVTNKRIYGKNCFGRRVDLPLDSISAIKKSWLDGVSISTSSGQINFLLFGNIDEIYNVISDLLINRQKANKDNSISTNNSSNYTNICNADEIKKYKELLDMGAITEEEYNEKKKKLLG